jgi:hypothetical protein
MALLHWLDYDPVEPVEPGGNSCDRHQVAATIVAVKAASMSNALNNFGDARRIAELRDARSGTGTWPCKQPGGPQVLGLWEDSP